MERGRASSYLLSLPPLAHDGGPFCNADSCVYTDGRNRFVSINFEVMLNKCNSPKRGGTPVPTDLFHLYKNPGNWA